MFTFKTNIHKDGEKIISVDTKHDSMEMSLDKMSVSDITKIEEMLQQNINTVCKVLRQEKQTIDIKEDGSTFKIPAGAYNIRKYHVYQQSHDS